jgi:integrase
MSLRKLPSGAWQWSLYTGEVAEGKRVRISGTQPTQVMAKVALKRARSELPEAGSERAQVWTIEEWLTSWFGEHQHRIEWTTAKRYEGIIRLHLIPHLGARRVDELTARHIDQMLAHTTTSPKKVGSVSVPASKRSRQQIRSVLNIALKAAVRAEIVDRNVCPSSLPPTGVVTRKMAPPDRDGATRLLEAARAEGETAEVLVHLAMHTGARRGELCALRWSDIVDGHVTIARALSVGKDHFEEKLTKTHSVRRFPLSPATINLLEKHYWRLSCISSHDESPLPEWVIADDPAAPWFPDRATSTFGRIRNAAGLPTVRLHDLRHFSATQLVAAGVPVSVVAERLGHADSSVTLRVYAHATPEGQQAATDVLGELLG